MTTWRPYGRIDSHIDAAVKYFDAVGHRFELEEVVELVLDGLPDTGFHGMRAMLAEMGKKWKGWEWDRVATEYVRTRARRCLQQEENRRFGGRSVGVRKYVNYRDHTGHWWWNPVRTLTVDELVMSVQQRTQQAEQLRAHIDVYQRLIDEARRRRVRTIGDIIDSVMPMEDEVRVAAAARP